jgi:hypothetical protein
VAAGETAIVFYNTVTGDVAKVSSTVNVSSFSAGTTGFTPSTATTGAVTLSGTLATTNGGTGLTSFTANGVVYASSTSALATGSALVFDGTNLGVGGSAVILPLEITAATSGVAFKTSASNFTYGAIYTTTSLMSIQAGQSGTGAYAPISFAVNGSEKMRLTTSGYLGIGTSSPSSILTVNGRVTLIGSGSEVYTSDASGLYLTAATPAGMYVAADGNFYFRKASSPYTEYMRIDSSGNLLVGTTSTSALPNGAGSTFTPQLQVGATPVAGIMAITTDGTNNRRVGLFADNTNSLIGISATTSTSYVPFVFRINGSENMRLDTSGNLLVGGTSQSGTANRVAVFSANKFGLSIIDTTAQASGVGGALNLGGNYRSAGDAQAFARVAAVKQNSTDADYGYGMSFSVTPNGGSFTEAARFDSSGNVGIGTSSPSAKLQTAVSRTSGTNTVALILSDNVTGVQTSGYGTQIQGWSNNGSAVSAIGFEQDGGTNNDTAIAFYTQASAGSLTRQIIINRFGSLTINQLGTGTVYSSSGTLTNTNPSDERLKIDVVNISWGLTDILALRPVSYKWKTDKINQGTQYGFIAQEVQSVMPELVREFETPDGARYGLEKEGIYATLVKAIQELNTLVTTQSAEIAALKQKVGI